MLKIASSGSSNAIVPHEWQSDYVPYPSDEYSDRLKDIIRVRWEGIWEEVRSRANEKES
ncbi:MAG: hypothetical protein AAF208_06105 [Cyanobacteria bacterium P01_A01_bin.45]